MLLQIIDFTSVFPGDCHHPSWAQHFPHCTQHRFLPLYLTPWTLVPPGVSDSTFQYDWDPLPHTIWHIPSALMSWELVSLTNNLNPLNMDKAGRDDSGHCEGGHVNLFNQMDLFSLTPSPGRGGGSKLACPGPLADFSLCSFLLCDFEWAVGDLCASVPLAVK